MYDYASRIINFPHYFSRCSGPEGCGLHLIDFKQSIDTRQFPEDQMFSGTSPHASSSWCSEVVEGRSWKWQLDYFGLALCLMALITKGVPGVAKSAESGRYVCSIKPLRCV